MIQQTYKPGKLPLFEPFLRPDTNLIFNPHLGIGPEPTLSWPMPGETRNQAVMLRRLYPLGFINFSRQPHHAIFKIPDLLLYDQFFNFMLLKKRRFCQSMQVKALKSKMFTSSITMYSFLWIAQLICADPSLAT